MDDTCPDCDGEGECARSTFGAVVPCPTCSPARATSGLRPLVLAMAERIALMSSHLSRLAERAECRGKEPPVPDSLAAAAVAAYCTQRGYPAPVPEHPFHPTRKWRLDLAFPAEKVAVEFEGGVYARGRHTRGSGYEGDIEKYNAAALAGWTVIRASYRQVEKGLLWDWLDLAFAGAADGRNG